MHLTGYLTNKSTVGTKPKSMSRSRRIEEPVLVCRAVYANSIDLSIRQGDGIERPWIFATSEWRWIDQTMPISYRHGVE